MATTLSCVLSEIASDWAVREADGQTTVIRLDELVAGIVAAELGEACEPKEVGPDLPDPEWISRGPLAAHGRQRRAVVALAD